MKNSKNKLLHTIQVNGFIKNIKFDDDVLVIETDHSIISFSQYHDQDCCEHVYADFSVMKYYVDQVLNKKITDIKIKSVEEMGFLISFIDNTWDSDFGRSVKVFIPCYDEQNGYYNSDLKLIINHNGVEKKLNISDCAEYIDI